MLRLEIEDNLFESFQGKVFNVEEQFFLNVEVEDTEYNRRAIEEIDEGQYLNELEFIDRFGYKWPVEYLSTGCKAALLVESGKCERVHLVECGRNARDFIICNASRGTAVLYRPGITVRDTTVGHTGEVNVEVFGKVFTDLGELNDWVF